MNTVLVWLLVTVSDGAYNRGTVNYSPPLATVEDCQRVQRHVQSSVVYTYCIQVNMKVEK
jgi:hypothetical protein